MKHHLETWHSLAPNECIPDVELPHRYLVLTSEGYKLDTPAITFEAVKFAILSRNWRFHGFVSSEHGFDVMIHTSKTYLVHTETMNLLDALLPHYLVVLSAERRLGMSK